MARALVNAPLADAAPPQLRLTRQFAVIAALALVVAGLFLVVLYRSWAVRELEAMAEGNNVAVARLLANTLLYNSPQGTATPGVLDMSAL